MTYSTGVYLLFSTQVNALPLASFQVGIRPCMDPDQQESRYFYPTELSQTTTCPVETNSDISYDPRYVQQPSNAFMTNEFAVQQASNVYSMLLFQPDYTYYYVSSPASKKQSINLYAWQRQTAYWDISCEWNNEMSRHQAV